MTYLSETQSMSSSEVVGSLSTVHDQNVVVEEKLVINAFTDNSQGFYMDIPAVKSSNEASSTSIQSKLESIDPQSFNQPCILAMDSMNLHHPTRISKIIRE
jgi:hypothetical protein